MKKSLLYLLLTVAFSSCTFTEEITIHTDGTGKYNLNIDGSALMAMMPQDSVGGKKEKPIDSTFSFKQLFEEKKDSISKLPKAQQEKIKKMEKFNLRMLMNNETKKFFFAFDTDFKSVSELEDVMDNMSEMQKMNKGAKETSLNPMGNLNVLENNGSKIKYAYDGKKFSRKAIVDKVALKKAKDSTDSYKMIFESSKYILKYHFPKAVKSVSNKTALFSEDRKTITIEHAFNEYVHEPEKLNFEVVFQK
ncbi:hypothetical protein EQG63_00610 [Flavobacterium amnicola]|uniref:Lipoprotein n=1 Tax=Flavobacterium amnicola TaxID=2506422 RepID=A0A4Q1K5M4_9FLAO|nr:hypothetical protein [Flavobacterium amnicola]RXR20464.1 hypothetical protein EQG63_00610 [Flavobacterium amnicola]